MRDFRRVVRRSLVLSVMGILRQLTSRSLVNSLAPIDFPYIPWRLAPPAKSFTLTNWLENRIFLGRDMG